MCSEVRNYSFNGLSLGEAGLQPEAGPRCMEPAAAQPRSNSRTREVEAANLIDVVNQLYGYDPAFQPLPYDALKS